eukprot:925220-Karenia_brevis.AAC.1
MAGNGGATHGMTGMDWTRDDSAMVEFASKNPHKEGSAIFTKYETVKMSKTVAEAKEKGAKAWDLADWFKKGSLQVLEKVQAKGAQDGKEET